MGLAWRHDCAMASEITILRQQHQPQYRGATLMTDKKEATINSANEQRSQIKTATGKKAPN
jgi:spore cortex formation protein SpoVR/YcgB (stage V sporulation)